MNKSHTWYGITTIALLSLAFTLLGFFQAVKLTSVSPPTSTPTAAPGTGNKPVKDNNVINILIMGDSIAKGTGDENFKGMGGYLPDLLKSQTPKNIAIENAGIDGYRIADLLVLVKSGRMDHRLQTADFVIISIGGNDLREIQNLTEVAREAAFQEKQDAYLSGLKEITRIIRSLNQNSVVIMVGLYNPAPADSNLHNAWFISNWNCETQLIIAGDQKAVFVPTYDLFKLNSERFIAADRLHPSSAGYQMISYLISKNIESVLS